MESFTQTPSTTARRKAVWGPKRTLVALALIALASPLSAFAAPKANSNNHNHRPEPASRHWSNPGKSKPGLPSSRVDDSKLDKFLAAKKGANRNSNETGRHRNPQSGSGPAGQLQEMRAATSTSSGLRNRQPAGEPAERGERESSVHRAHFNHAAKSLDLSLEFRGARPTSSPSSSGIPARAWASPSSTPASRRIRSRT